MKKNEVYSLKALEDAKFKNTIKEQLKNPVYGPDRRYDLHDKIIHDNKLKTEQEAAPLQEEHNVEIPGKSSVEERPFSDCLKEIEEREALELKISNIEKRFASPAIISFDLKYFEITRELFCRGEEILINGKKPIYVKWPINFGYIEIPKMSAYEKTV